jgi:hypothetical protein
VVVTREAGVGLRILGVTRQARLNTYCTRHMCRGGAWDEVYNFNNSDKFLTYIYIL